MQQQKVPALAPSNARFWLSTYLAVLYTVYCAVYLIACPSRALFTAVGTQVLFLLVSLAIYRANIFTVPSSLTRRLPQAFTRCAAASRKWLDRCIVAALLIVVTVATIDFSALALACARMYNASRAIYSSLPITYWLGLHPAFTLEILAGALVEHQNYNVAEPLYRELVSIRIIVAGPRSDLASAIYADMGDFCVRKHDLSSAVDWYRRSVALGSRTGRAYTGLASALRERGDFSESERCYLEALRIRKQLYGTQSRQYNDTLHGYIRLQQLMKKPQHD